MTAHILHRAAVIPDADTLADMQAQHRLCERQAHAADARSQPAAAQMWQARADLTATRIEEHIRATALSAADRIAEDADDVPLYGDGDLGFGDQGPGSGVLVWVLLVALVAEIVALGIGGYVLWRVLSGGIVT